MARARVFALANYRHKTLPEKSFLHREGAGKDGSSACMTIEGPVNAEVFRVDVLDVPLPTLKAGGILVMANPSTH